MATKIKVVLFEDMEQMRSAILALLRKEIGRVSDIVPFDQTLFKVNPKIRAAFVARLDTPPAPNEKLRRMMAAPAPWNE